MIMSGSSTRTLGQGGLLAAIGLATALLPFSPSLGQEPQKKGRVDIIIKDGENPEKSARIVTLDGEAIDLDLSQLPLILEHLKGHPLIVGEAGIDAKHAELIDRLSVLKDMVKPAEIRITKPGEALVVSPQAAALEAKIAQVEARLEKVKRIASNKNDPALKALADQLDTLKDAKAKLGDEAKIQLRVDLQDLKGRLAAMLAGSQDKQAADAKAGEPGAGSDELKVDLKLEDLKGLVTTDDGQVSQVVVVRKLQKQDQDQDDAKKTDKAPEASPDQEKLKAEIKELSERVKAASQQMVEARKRLAEAQRRLAEVNRDHARAARVEAESKGRTRVRIERKETTESLDPPKAEGETQRRVEVRARVVPDRPGEQGPKMPAPVIALPRRIEARARAAGDAQEKRIDELEKKLDKIIEQLQSIKKGRQD